MRYDDNMNIQFTRWEKKNYFAKCWIKYQSKGSIGKEEEILRESSRINNNGKEDERYVAFVDFQTTFHKTDRMILIIKKLKRTGIRMTTYEKTVINITGDIDDI